MSQMYVVPAVCVCSLWLAKMSLWVYSILPKTSGVFMMPCLSLFKHTQADQMKEQVSTQNTTFSVSGRDGPRGSDTDQTHRAHRARGEGGGEGTGPIDIDRSTLRLL